MGRKITVRNVNVRCAYHIHVAISTFSEMFGFKREMRFLGFRFLKLRGAARVKRQECPPRCCFAGLSAGAAADGGEGSGRGVFRIFRIFRIIRNLRIIRIFR